MAFIRTVKRENPFVQLDKTFFEDENLQWESKGVLGYILSRPDNWKINQTDLTKRSSGGKGKVETALLDLMANGYVHWYSIRNEDGTIKEWVYDVYERPEFNPKKDECIAEGKRRIEEKKTRNKRKNEKKSNHPETGYPEVDNPEVGYPEVDNPSYNNINLNNIKEEEEEEKPLFFDLEKSVKEFLLTQLHYDESLINDIAKQMIAFGITTFSKPEMIAQHNYMVEKNEIERITDWDFYFVNGIAIKRNNPSNKISDETKTKRKTRKNKEKYIRTEIVPEWMKKNQEAEQNGQTPEQPATPVISEERKREIWEQVMKMTSGNNDEPQI